LRTVSDWQRRARWIVVVVVVGLVGALASWYFAIWTPPVAKRTLRIGFEQNPPVQIRTDGGFSGLAVEIINEAAKRGGLSLEWVDTGTSSDEAFQRGLVDLWPLMADLPDRRKHIHFTRPWLQTAHTLVRRSSTPVLDRSFEGRIALFKLPLHVRLLRSEFPKAQPVEFDDSKDIMKAVCSGAASAGFMEDRVALRGLLGKPAECAAIELRIDPLHNLTVAIGTASTFEAAGAADKLRSEIGVLFQDGTMAATTAKYSFYGLDDSWTTYKLMQDEMRARWRAWGMGAFGIALVITIAQAIFLRQRKRSEAALRASEARFRAIFDQAAVGVAQVTLDGEVTMVNDRYCEVLGYPRAELLGKKLVEKTWVDDCPAVLANRGRLLAGDFPSYSMEIRSVRQDGGVCWITSCESLVSGEDRAARYSLAVVDDITRRKHAEAALQESETRFRTLADTAPVMIWLSGTDKLATFFNSGWLNFTGSTMEETLGIGWSFNVHPDDRDGCIENYSSAFDARRVYHRECRLRRADGEYRLIFVTGAPRFESNGEFAGYVGVCTDITDLKKSLEEGLARQKLESVGVLASGIAHDFNNLLGGILAETEFMAEQSASPLEGMQRIGIAASRGADIVRQLLIYAGQQDADPMEPVDLSRLVEEMLDLLKISIAKNVSLKTDLQQNLPAIAGKASPVRQIVMNLVINASEAMGERGGTIRVATSRLVLDSVPDTSVQLPPGDYLKLEVSDTGGGMTKEVLAKIFDPFFSTKFAGRGLGLAVVQGIVRDHGGVINVVSVPGEGTTFAILLPCVSDTLPNNSARKRAPESAPETAPGTILFVEDEETLRRTFAKMLRSRGFEVTEAMDGDAALELLRSPNDIHVMLLDMTLPGASSRQVLEEARSMRPNLKVILTSAHNKETVDAYFAGLRVEHFIRKPFRIFDLVNLLGGPPGKNGA
jgi:two-component system, cell cycle sensor histidine kinase and response regulator CckA